MPQGFHHDRRHRFTTVLLLGPALLFASLTAQAETIKRMDRIDAQIDEILQPYDRPEEPGLSVIVIKNDNVVYKRACGLADLEAKIPNTTRTNFRLASISKQFTAMAILILVERGKIRLDNRLSDFLPRFPAYGREITVRQLLNHTAGLPDYAEHIPAGQTEQLTDLAVLRILEQLKNGDFPPGSQFAYSNSNYVLLGLIVEQVSGQPFPRFLAENIFEPCGMTNTIAYVAGKSTVKNRAFGYTPNENKFQRTDQSLTSATLGDGGIYSSVEDMARWDQSLYTTKLVSADALNQMFSANEHGIDRSSGYGFGWFIDDIGGTRKVWHGGGAVGFRNQIVRFPDEKFSVVVLMNRSDGNPEVIANRIAKICVPASVAIQPPVAKVSPAVLDAYAGYYDVRGSVSKMTAREGKLFWFGVGLDPVELLPLSRDTFFYADPDINPARDWTITFEMDTQNHTNQLVYKVGGKEVFVAPYLGPLTDTLVPRPDPDPKFTLIVQASLKAFALGGKALDRARDVTCGAKKHFSDHPMQEFKEFSSLRYLTELGIADWDILRLGSKASKIIYYKSATNNSSRCVLVFVTTDRMISDAIVVDE